MPRRVVVVVNCRRVVVVVVEVEGITRRRGWRGVDGLLPLRGATLPWDPAGKVCVALFVSLVGHTPMGLRRQGMCAPFFEMEPRKRRRVQVGRVIEVSFIRPAPYSPLFLPPFVHLILVTLSLLIMPCLPPPPPFVSEGGRREGGQVNGAASRLKHDCSILLQTAAE